MKMNQNEMQKKLEELMANTEFTDKLAQCGTFDEIAALFGTEEIEVSGEELERAMAQVPVQGENGEISEGDLEQVSGGCFTSGLAWWLRKHSIDIFGRTYGKAGPVFTNRK
jgi:hypothetical protein